MPELRTLKRARKARRQGKSASSQAGEFVREEIHHVREGKHGARSTRQAIAIGLSKARRAGVRLRVPERGRASEETRERARRDLAQAADPEKVSRRRSQASHRALEREGHEAASHGALSRQARASARRRAAGERSAAAKEAARTRARPRSRR